MMEKSVSAGQIVGNSSATTEGRRISHCSQLNSVGDFSRNPAYVNTKKISSKKNHHAKYSNSLDEIRFQYPNFENETCGKLSNYKNAVYDFVTAKCRLLVDTGMDLTGAMMCPDNSLQWSDIKEVRFPQTEPTTCPICLLPPVAPRIGPCGHIYCWSCVYHYIGYENDLNSKKCAVCNVFLRRNELKRVKISSVCIPSIGNSCKFTLMKRRKDSMFPTPAKLLSDSVSFSFPLEDSPSSIFSRISIMNLTKMKIMLLQDKQCIEAYLSECHRDVEMDYIIPTLEEIISGLDIEFNSTNLIEEKSSPPPVPPQSNLSNSNQVYTYYEDVNGHDLYLHGVNWRCLSAEYTENELPEQIHGEVIQVDCYTMTPELRRRYRFLSHLPIGRSFYFVELDLRPPLVSIHALFQVSDMLTSRSLNREKKWKMEKSLSRAKAEAENRIQSLSLGSRISAPINLDTVPTEDDFMPLPTTNTFTAEKAPSRRSFAVVSALGASSYVDSRRIATFSNSSSNVSDKKSLIFDPSEDAWPTLGISKPSTTNQAKSSWGSSITTTLSSESANSSSADLDGTLTKFSYSSQRKTNRDSTGS